MNHYLIERHIPGVGALGPAHHKDIAATSNLALAALGGRAQWRQSYVALDNTFCVYFAEDEEVLREHSRLAGFPITRINPILAVLDPLSAFRPLHAAPARAARRRDHV